MPVSAVPMFSDNIKPENAAFFYSGGTDSFSKWIKVTMIITRTTGARHYRVKELHVIGAKLTLSNTLIPSEQSPTVSIIRTPY